MSRLLAIILTGFLLVACKDRRKLIVTGQFSQDYTNDADLRYGVKFYQIPVGHGYTKAQVYEVENGHSKLLATHPIDASESLDTILTFSTLPANGSVSWTAWADRTGVGATHFLQGELPEEWYLANASQNRIIALEETNILVDTIILRRKSAPPLSEAEDPIHNLFAESLEALVETTQSAKDYKVLALTIHR